MRPSTEDHDASRAAPEGGPACWRCLTSRMSSRDRTRSSRVRQHFGRSSDRFVAQLDVDVSAAETFNDRPGAFRIAAEAYERIALAENRRSGAVVSGVEHRDQIGERDHGSAVGCSARTAAPNLRNQNDPSSNASSSSSRAAEAFLEKPQLHRRTTAVSRPSCPPASSSR